MKKTRTQGFTLLEILLVVAAIAILAGIVIIAINPNKQLGDTRNAQRRSDVNSVLNATYQYALDHNGILPPAVLEATTVATSTQICSKTGYTDCIGLTELSELSLNEKYLVAIPADPMATTTNGTGYYIHKSANNRVIVESLAAEQGATISVSR